MERSLEWGRQAVALDSEDWGAQTGLIAALALAGRDAEAREALQRYLALPSSGPKTIAAFKASIAPSDKPDDPGVSEFFARKTAGLRQAGMPEK
jgi:hypothetical protein